MNEVRKVIGVFDDLVATKGAREFPSVRVWIRGPNDFITGGLTHAFPTRGTVFLRLSACENERPRLDQIGLFNCIRSKPGESAEWMVETTSRRLVNVFDCPWELQGQPGNFWRWLNGYEERKPCDILLGDGTAYVKTQKSELIGPFSLSEQGKFIVRGSTFLFENVEVAYLKIAGNRYGFVDLDLLQKGEPIILDPREAILRRLKSIYRGGQIAGLSRGKIQELADALANIEDAAGTDWVMGSLPAALSLLCESGGGTDRKLVDALLEIAAIEEALKEAWETKHAESIKKSQDEIQKLQARLAELKSRTKTAEAELAASEATLTELKDQIETGKDEAQRAFDSELKRLARSPATMAVLGAWRETSFRSDYRQLSIVEQHRSEKQEHVSEFADALIGNLKNCGLSPRLASEVSTICQAALAAGQLICFRSTFSDILAEAVASAFGQRVTLWADVPAGLLDPVDWNSLLDNDQKGSPIILQAANRSDTSLVLGSMRLQLFREALGFEKPSTIILITLEPRAEMSVEGDVPFGPIVDDPVLKFQCPKGVASAYSCAEFAQQIPEIQLISHEDFATAIGEEIIRLPLFSVSSQEIAYRRSYAALQAIAPEADNAPRIFFKYWCLPRLSSAAVQSIFEVYKEDWRQDQILIQCMEAAAFND